ncbi:MAG: hypothetical protein E6J65_13395 [Deltaproteobacteria bacterium]|nr:MAG: hypothetical protein E6J65_13395 [Deltaproteobacteria bacterium]
MSPGPAMSKPGGILRQAGPLMLGRGGATVVGFALPLILTRLLPQAEFGTYKQVWLVVTTAYFMLQLGLAQSLYYFLPRKDGRERAWLTQASMALVTLGAVCAAVLYGSRFLIARQFANPELATFALPMAVMTWLMIAAAPLEISLTAEGRVRTAAWIIFLSDAVRVAASVVPLLLGLGLHGFFWAYVVHAAVRFGLQCWFFFRRGGPQIDWTLMREQLAYALPFGAAVLLEIPQRTFHQWAVGWSVDAATFAIYAQGCFQVPIVNLLYAPISDILQVRFAESGVREHRVHLFHDANLRLAAVFFPFTAGMVAAAPLFIPALFTHVYDPSTVLIGLKLFGLMGAITGHALAESVVRLVMLDRVRRELALAWREVLPWGQLAVIACASLAACVPAVLISGMAAAGPRPFLALCAAGALYCAVYLGVIALMPGEGPPVARVRRMLLGATAAPV